MSLLDVLPPGRVWLPVWDLPSALAALELLRRKEPDPPLPGRDGDRV